MPSTDSRRTSSSVPTMSRRPTRAAKRGRLSSSGITTSLHSMVLSDTAATMTMPVAADRPPMKDSRLKPLAPAAIGRVIMKVSGLMPSPKVIRPATAMGIISALSASR